MRRKPFGTLDLVHKHTLTLEVGVVGDEQAGQAAVVAVVAEPLDAKLRYGDDIK